MQAVALRTIFVLIALLLICTIFTAFITAAESTRDKYMQKADNYFARGKFELAEVYYRKVIEIDAEVFTAYYNVGRIEYKNNDFKGAVAHLGKAADLEPENTNVVFVLANALADSGEPELALKAYSRLREINSNHAFSYLNEGIIYYRLLCNRSNTIRAWEHFLKLYPDYVQAPEITIALGHLRDPNFKIPCGSNGQIAVPIFLNNGQSADIQSDGIQTPSWDIPAVIGEDSAAPTDDMKIEEGLKLDIE